jgi:hypothetical protein
LRRLAHDLDTNVNNLECPLYDVSSKRFYEWADRVAEYCGLYEDVSQESTNSDDIYKSGESDADGSGSGGSDNDGSDADESGSDPEQIYDESTQTITTFKKIPKKVLLKSKNSPKENEKSHMKLKNQKEQPIELTKKKDVLEKRTETLDKTSPKKQDTLLEQTDKIPQLKKDDKVHIKAHVKIGSQTESVRKTDNDKYKNLVFFN